MATSAQLLCAPLLVLFVAAVAQAVVQKQSVQLTSSLDSYDVFQTVIPGAANLAVSEHAVCKASVSGGVCASSKLQCSTECSKSFYATEAAQTSLVGRIIGLIGRRIASNIGSGTGRGFPRLPTGGFPGTFGRGGFGGVGGFGGAGGGSGNADSGSSAAFACSYDCASSCKAMCRS